jgi:pyridoxal phosphate enzyme (YggS family)
MNVNFSEQVPVLCKNAAKVAQNRSLYMKFAPMLQELLQAVATKNARLIAVSKTHPAERILELYEKNGLRDFGENRPQEMLDKYRALPADITWHMIGHLQTNKVKYIAPFVGMIHSVDSLRLLQEIDKQAQKCGRVIDCLLQFYIAEEESKFGLDEAEAIGLLESPAYAALQNVRLCGVMGMATFTEKHEQVRGEFRRLKQIFEQLKQRYFADQPHFREISMGMSGDWQIALEEGSTMIRVGSLIFGER